MSSTNSYNVASMLMDQQNVDESQQQQRTSGVLPESHARVAFSVRSSQSSKTQQRRRRRCDDNAVLVDDHRDSLDCVHEQWTDEDARTFAAECVLETVVERGVPGVVEWLHAITHQHTQQQQQRSSQRPFPQSTQQLRRQLEQMQQQSSTTPPLSAPTSNSSASVVVVDSLPTAYSDEYETPHNSATAAADNAMLDRRKRAKLTSSNSAATRITNNNNNNQLVGLSAVAAHVYIAHQLPAEPSSSSSALSPLLSSRTPSSSSSSMKRPLDSTTTPTTTSNINISPTDDATTFLTDNSTNNNSFGQTTSTTLSAARIVPVDDVGARHANQRAAFTLHLFDTKFTINDQTNELRYGKETRALLEAIDGGRLTREVQEMVGTLDCQYVHGALLVELRDYRGLPPLPHVAALPFVRHVLLKPTSESLLHDVNQLWSRIKQPNWTVDEYVFRFCFSFFHFNYIFNKCQKQIVDIYRWNKN